MKNMITSTGSNNGSFVVSTLFPCDEITEGLEVYRPDPVWRTTAFGCKMLQLLQEMYQFQMTYQPGTGIYLADNVTKPDIYAKPMPLMPYNFEQATPIHPLINRRYGFLLRSTYQPITVRAFYSLPFSTPAWFFLTVMTFCVITPVLCFLCRWERRLVSGRQEYSLINEMMVMLGACCQHIPPVNPILQSRRLTYFVVFMYTWMTFSYYSSNLLSYLVNDKEKAMTLEQMVGCDYQIVALDSLQLYDQLPWLCATLKRNFQKMNQLKEKYENMRRVNISTGLAEIGHQKVALLSDYSTIYPYVKTYLDNKAICDIIEVVLFSNIHEYIYTSKYFPLKDEFRIGMLRIKESGVMKRVKQGEIYSAPKCQHSPDSVATFQHIVGPLLVLGCAYFVSIIVLILERVYHEWNKVWPFVN